MFLFAMCVIVILVHLLNLFAVTIIHLQPIRNTGKLLKTYFLAQHFLLINNCYLSQ